MLSVPEEEFPRKDHFMKAPSVKMGLSILFVLILFGLQGCGSGGDTLSTPAPGGEAGSVADVKFTVKWDDTAPPGAPNKILNAAQGLKVTVTGPRIAASISNGVNRTTGSTQETITLNAVPTGDNTFLIEVFNSAWEQATSTNLIQQTTTPFTVAEGVVNKLTVNLASDLCFAVAATPATKTIGVGDTQQFTAVATNADNEILLAKTVTWSSSDPTVASVDSTGLAAGVKRGSVNIQASCDNRSGQAGLNVIIARPKNVKATGGDGRVTLTWDPVTGAGGYRLYYRTAPGVTKGNGTLVSNASSPAVVSNLTNGTAYYFVVTAFIGNEESFESAEVSATPILSTGTVEITIK